MYFPRYWTKAAIKGPNREGEEWEAEAWGWSDNSLEEARQKAQERARDVLARLPITQRTRGDRDSYYENRPFREPVLHDFSQGKVKALVSRNSLGCEVLNTDCIGFGDIDYVPERTSVFASLFDFGGKKAAAREKEWEGRTLESLRRWRQSNLTWSFRVYRTAGGLRLLVTSRLLKADAPEALEWLKAIEADPLYVRLCKTQQSFRARLTPKPWRCGLRKPPMVSPWDDPVRKPAMQKWLEKYQRESMPYAICEFIEEIGSETAAECRPFISLHDEKTLAMSGKPLA